MASHDPLTNLYSIVIAIHPEGASPEDSGGHAAQADWRTGHISVDWVDFTREKAVDGPSSSTGSNSTTMPGAGQATKAIHSRKKSTPPRTAPTSGTAVSSPASPSRTRPKERVTDPDALSLQPLLAHFPGPNPLDSSRASGVSQVGRGVVHLFRHAPPAPLIASLDAHPVGESSKSAKETGDWAGSKAEGEDGSLIAILAVPAWMRPADFLEFIGGWSNCLEGVRMIRCVSQRRC